jgi:RTX calcium-binding nonapeptide repeat (4 copies)
VGIPASDGRTGNRCRSPVSLSAQEVNSSERKSHEEHDSTQGCAHRQGRQAGARGGHRGGRACRRGWGCGRSGQCRGARGDAHQASEAEGGSAHDRGHQAERGDRIALRLQAGDSGVLELDVGDDGYADFDFTREKIARIELDAGAGADLVRIDEGNGVFSEIPTIIDGGAGADSLAGGSGAELLLGGDGNDSIDGNRGNDVTFAGAGDDTFVWDPGDGSDVVEGQDGADTMLFNGAGAAEHVDLSANGNRLRFFRNPGNITMDTRSVERVDFIALGGADVVNVNDLTGTDVTSVNVDLVGTLGGAAGDGQMDRVVVNGTNGNDAITVNGDAGGVKVSGLASTVGILRSEAANDRLEINTLAGTDTADSGGLAAGAVQLFVDGALVP